MEDINLALYTALPVLFLVIAVVTRKDLAIIAATLSWLGVWAVSKEYEYAVEMMSIIGLNSILAISAALYNNVRKCNLSITIAVMALAQTMVNLVQLFSNIQIYGTITAVIELGMLSALILMDGRRELLNGMVGSVSFFAQHRLHHSSDHNNNKGGA